ETLWLLGTQGYAAYQNLRTGQRPRVSEGFCDAGYYFLRANRLQITANCADVGMCGAYGGHAHCDCLSFELSCGSKTPITDCGSFIYGASPHWRNRFRATESHNTVRLDAVE